MSESTEWKVVRDEKNGSKIGWYLAVLFAFLFGAVLAFNFLSNTQTGEIHVREKVHNRTVISNKVIYRNLSAPEAVFTKLNPSLVSITSIGNRSVPFGSSSQGSGFVYNKRGYIVTNYHVVEGSSVIRVTLPSGEVVRADLIGGDPYTDLAVLKVDVDPDKLDPVTIGDSDSLKVGQPVLAIGNPFGLSGSMSSGIISQLGRRLRTQQQFSTPDAIQIDAAINPGNSGGPLANFDGEVIGVTTAIQSTTGSFIGIGFAIPSNSVKRIVPDLIENGVYKHPWIGVEGVDVSPEIAEEMNLDQAKGFLVTDVVDGSPADKAGIKPGNNTAQIYGREIDLGGDVIIGIGDRKVRKVDDILMFLAQKTQVGDVINLTVIRDKRRAKY